MIKNDAVSNDDAMIDVITLLNNAWIIKMRRQYNLYPDFN